MGSSETASRIITHWILDASETLLVDKHCVRILRNSSGIIMHRILRNSANRIIVHWILNSLEMLLLDKLRMDSQINPTSR